MKRRDFLKSTGAAAGAALVSARTWAAEAPALPVALARCESYGPGVLDTLRTMFDQIGGIGSLVKGKTVAVKVNMVSNPDIRAGFIAIERMTYTHPDVIAAAVHLISRAGASRIRILEGPWKSAEPLEEYMISAGWEPDDFIRASSGAKVEFENTNFLGYGKEYFRFPVPKGGLLFPAYDLNHSYRDCDVMVSLGKLKEHRTAGVTLSIKNCFGITPCTIYGEGAPENEPGLVPRGGRQFIHSGSRQPSKSSPSEIDPTSPREGGYRIPRCIADLVAARPVDLAVIDGIESMNNGENTGTSRTVRQAARAHRGQERGQHRRRGRRGDGLRPDGRPRHAAFRARRQHAAPGRKPGRRDSRLEAYRSGRRQDQRSGLRLPQVAPWA